MNNTNNCINTQIKITCLKFLKKVKRFLTSEFDKM